MITVEELTINVFTSKLPKWIAVIKGNEAIVSYSMFTESKNEIIEADNMEALLTTLNTRGIKIVERFEK